MSPHQLFAFSELLSNHWTVFLSYSLLLLMGLVSVFSQPIDHGWGFAAKGGVWALSIVELNPFPDTSFGL